MPQFEKIVSQVYGRTSHWKQGSCCLGKHTRTPIPIVDVPQPTTRIRAPGLICGSNSDFSSSNDCGDRARLLIRGFKGVGRQQGDNGVKGLGRGKANVRVGEGCRGCRHKGAWVAEQHPTTTFTSTGGYEK